ncbi:MAG TPA: XisH family protein [Nostocaceae cyanobacterium]|nr:XisH family protein [Nostocaceae cyanobacterium]
MPARDAYHHNVRNALIKDGWIITHDPLRIRLMRGKNLFVDLGAEKLLAAEKGLEKIAVEVKSFTRASDMKDLEEAVGQFIVYDRLLKRYYPEHKLYLAVSENVRKSVFEEEAGETLIEDGTINLFSFDPVKEEIVKWIQQL